VSNRKPPNPALFALDRSRAVELPTKFLELATDVARYVRKRLPFHAELDDLVGDANVGLMEATQRFNPFLGTPFSAFAKHRIRGAVADGLRRLDRVSRHLRIQQLAAERAIASAGTAFGRSPTQEEIAAKLGLSLDRWNQVRYDLSASGCQLLGCAMPNSVPTIPENIPSKGADPEESAALAERRSWLTAALRHLPARHRAVVCLYYARGWTMREIGAKLLVTESRVSQIHTQAIEELQARLSSPVLSRPAT